GARLLRRWLQRPTRQQNILQQRYAVISALLAEQTQTELRNSLNQITDIERILTRIALKSARPRDLTGLRQSLQILPAIKTQLHSIKAERIQSLLPNLNGFDQLCDLLERAIKTNPPVVIRDGGVINDGFDNALDELRALSQSSDNFLVELEQSERQRTNIPTLKVGYNRVHGFYIEISRAQAKTAPAEYIRRQTLKNVERYITPELKRYEEKVLSARAKALSREKILYEQLLENLNPHLSALKSCADTLSELDVLSNFAHIAQQYDLKPANLTQTPGIHIKSGRHIVVEQISSEAFIPNDTELNAKQRLLMITGPNMGGKSTYMRQTALIVIMAHIGSFVPAESAVIGPIDRIFTRIGANDDLASGRSTFMVEMTETANILHHATTNSLILMDEIGRGTSTFDGLSLAWAAAEYLASQVNAFSLFATHYFELTRLSELFTTVSNIHIDASEKDEHIVFTHRVKSGPANQSYGIQVARLAGIPQTVIERAQIKLCELEAQAKPNATSTSPLQKSLFQDNKTEPLLEELANINPDTLTAPQALNCLYDLVQQAKVKLKK
ncbi:MAG: DNA mismatch repair protein MutS, partial [Gammaproteobacteria bacterium]|nr:DNA mismatch repair protein MutS [Gammaproteobacteria bacterium]